MALSFATAPSPYDTGLDRNAANFAPLTPLTLLDWAASACPDRVSTIYGERRITWRETYTRCRRLASALERHGIGRGDTVAAMLFNTPEMFECQFGVPMCGAVLNALNVRLDPGTLAFMLDHGEAKALLVDREFSATMADALTRCRTRPLVIDVDDPEYSGPGERLGALDYGGLLAEGDPEYPIAAPTDEWDAIALNYTSGTTGNPKGVVFHHRGAYLAALGTLLAWGVPRQAVFLWIAPMFHCNGWCLPWALPAVAGTGVCLRKFDAAVLLHLIREHRATHFGAAPIVHQMLASAPAELWDGITHRINGYIAGAAPPAAVLEAMERRGVEITHTYGLTETYGPATVCVKQEEWAALEPRERALRNGRQGIRFQAEEGATVLDPDTMQPVPRDGETMGEIMFRGNMTMKGYLKNPTATEAAFAGGWFHSGDLAVMHPDGYMKVKDRGKDIIISGGENISSLEVEDALHRHPAVFVAAVVAKPDPTWGEAPCAYVELKPGASVTEAELIEHCRSQIAHYKAPRSVVFGPLPKTATGKIQKYVLRERARSVEAIE
ncbi:MAG TPA: acyl-CoA synthetase [Gemmatimonadales bacterium]|nr:acyl-CoA synthetase [Gemmatimonadales bacterium]